MRLRHVRLALIFAINAALAFYGVPLFGMVFIMLLVLFLWLVGLVEGGKVT